MAENMRDGDHGKESVKFVTAPADLSQSSEESGTQMEDDEWLRSVLEPDHPLLSRFQRTLRDHLTKQIAHLKTEVLEVESGAKTMKQDREQLGLETYEVQQQVNKQQHDLENYVQELDTICSATEQLEHDLEEAKDAANKKKQELFDTELAEVHVRTELEGVDLLLQKMRSWEVEVENELTVNQRIFEKTKRDKAKMIEEQRQQDMIIYKLMTENWRLEEELQKLDMQLRVKEEERETMAQTIANANVEIEMINTEHRCILHSWNSIIVTIGLRDNQYYSIKKDLDALIEKMRSIQCEMEQTKKLCKKEMNQNERLTDMKCRLQMDIDNCKKQFEMETKKRMQLEAQMDANQRLLDQINADIDRLMAENANKQTEISLLIKQIEKLVLNKQTIEQKTMATLEEQLTNSKAAKYINKMLNGVLETNRNLEITLTALENQNAKVVMEIEAQKVMNEEIQRFLEETLGRHDAMEKKFNDLNAEVENLQFIATKKQRQVDFLTLKIEQAIAKQGGVDASPLEIKRVSLEKSIVDLREEIKQLQKFWLRQQGHMVSLTQQRQEQINDSSLVKKQMLLLVQKNLKVNDEYAQYKQLEEKMNKSINNMLNRLGVINEEIFKRKGNKNQLLDSNQFLQSEYNSKLNDAEMELIKLEADITLIEEEKVAMTNELVDLNREALSWEKKIQMAVETKKEMDQEKGEGGEVGNMKAEIHRMEVRYRELQKAQFKLIHDLEHCISRREAMLTNTEAREKKEKGGLDKTRLNFARKLDDMRNKVTQLEGEIRTLESKEEAIDQEAKRLNEELTKLREDIAQLEERINKYQEKIEEAKTLKQRNLEVLVLKQRKVKTYSELHKHRNPYILYKTPSIISAECEKQKEINSQLTTVVGNLVTDYPNYNQVLTRIQNTLRIPHIYL